MGTILHKGFVNQEGLTGEESRQRLVGRNRIAGIAAELERTDCLDPVFQGFFGIGQIFLHTSHRRSQFCRARGRAAGTFRQLLLRAVAGGQRRIIFHRCAIRSNLGQPNCPKFCCHPFQFFLLLSGLGLLCLQFPGLLEQHLPESLEFFLRPAILRPGCGFCAVRSCPRCTGNRNCFPAGGSRHHGTCAGQRQESNLGPSALHEFLLNQV